METGPLESQQPLFPSCHALSNAAFRLRFHQMWPKVLGQRTVQESYSVTRGKQGVKVDETVTVYMEG